MSAGPQPTTTKSLPDILEDGFRRIFFDELGRYGNEWAPYYHMETSTRKDETDSGVGTLGLWPTRDEGDAVVYDGPHQGFDVTYTHQEWALGFQLTQIMMEDAMYGVMPRMPAQLGTSLRETEHNDIFSDLNNGFNTSYAGGDGKPLFAADHPLYGGGTESNVAATPSDLSVSSWEQAGIDIASWVDDRGKKVNMRIARLAVHKNNEYNAKRIFNSSHDPNSGNNAVNPAAGTATADVLHYITDPDAWYVQCDTHFMYHFTRIPASFGRENDFDTDNIKHKGRARWSHGWSDWYGMYGNAGGSN